MEGANGRSELLNASPDELATLASSIPGAGADPEADAHEAVLRMCHDLVTPAVTIRHLAEAIEAEPGLSPQVRRHIALIAAESTHISEICGFTLEMVREPRPVRLDEVVSECAAGARAWFAGTIDEDTDHVTIRAQRVPMFRLVSNLLNNACRAAGSDGRVSIRLDHDRVFAYMEVVNNGAQFESAVNLGTLQSENPTTLGLRIVSQILAEHRAQACIEPNGVGGTSVRVQIPLDTTREPPETGRWFGEER
ncbi:MAG TPA: ATP-binding protein [Acidimicrobiales bacterium]|nr:ATP-binding protein [Acidimicrobiales bacterium]